MVAAVTSATPHLDDRPVDAPAAETTNPAVRARELLDEGQRLLGEALQAMQSGAAGAAGATGGQGPADLVGQSSDRVGSALYHLRSATRR